jgi:hypothetical protein
MISARSRYLTKHVRDENHNGIIRQLTVQQERMMAPQSLLGLCCYKAELRPIRHYCPDHPRIF